MPLGVVVDTTFCSNRGSNRQVVVVTTAVAWWWCCLVVVVVMSQTRAAATFAWPGLSRNTVDAAVATRRVGSKSSSPQRNVAFYCLRSSSARRTASFAAATKLNGSGGGGGGGIVDHGDSGDSFATVYEPRIPLVLPQPQLGTAATTTTGGSKKQILTVAAPMVAASDYAFRCVTRQHHGADATFTQMLHARNLISDDTFYQNHWDLHEYNDNDNSDESPLLLQSQINLLDGDRRRSHFDTDHDEHECWNPPDPTALQGPVICQLAGNHVDQVVAAAHKLLASTNHHLAGIDFNLGCPQGIARKGRYGAFLMEQDATTVYAILSALRQSLPDSVAVSAKIRLPLDPSTQSDRLRRLCDTGIDFLTVHGRDLTENKATVSGVHMERLAAAVATVQHHAGIPVIVNGGVETTGDMHRLLQYTQASAIMSSEALLERPNLFAVFHANREQRVSVDPIWSMTPRQRFDEQVYLAETYLRWSRYAPPVPGVLGMQGGSFNVVRGHLFKILYRYLNEHVDVRDALANNFDTQRWSQAWDLVQQLKRRYQDLNDSQWETLPSSLYPQSTWYRRHWSSPAKSAPSEAASVSLSLDERKQAVRERIAKLQSQKSTSTMATEA
jgi:tRNA-dihydrouridine synthase